MTAIEPLASLPLFFKLDNRRALVAGNGGGVAWKAELLAAAGASVRLCAPAPRRELETAAAVIANVEFCRRPWSAIDFDDVALAILETESEAEAKEFWAAARRAGVPVNVVDRPKFCDFSFGSIVNRSPLVAAISTDGAAPVFGQAVRARIEVALPRALSAWAEAARLWRARLAPLGLDFRRRRRFWERFAEMALRAGAKAPSEADFAALAEAQEHASEPAPGRIVLIGAGPGDPELLTMKAIAALQSADVIFFDHQVDPGVLDLARREARRIEVRAASAEEMVALAGQGKTVVRLESGDAGLFGRAGREFATAREAGIEIETIPGVTAAVAALDIWLAGREPAQRLQFAWLSDTGSAHDRISWRALADPDATTALHLSARQLAATVDRLMNERLDPATPAVYLENVGRRDEVRVIGSLAELPLAVAGQAGEGPALLLYGRALARGEN